MAKFKKEQILNRAINQRYLNDIEDVINKARKILSNKDNKDGLKELDDIMYRIRRFVDIQSTNRSGYQMMKEEADIAKDRLAVLLSYLNLLEKDELKTKVDKIEVEQADTKKRLDDQDKEIAEVKKRQDDQDRKQDNIEKRQAEFEQEQRQAREQDRQQRQQENSEYAGVLNKILHAQNLNTERISKHDQDISNLNTQLTTLDKKLSDEIATIKNDLQQITRKMDDYIQENKDVICARLKKALPQSSNPSSNPTIPPYTVNEYHKVMAIISVMNDLGLSNGKSIATEFQNKLNLSLHNTLPKIVSDVVNGFLDANDFKIKTAILSHHEQSTCQLLFDTALKSIQAFHPSSELISMGKDAAMVLAHTGVLIKDLISAKKEETRKFEGKKQTADEMVSLFNMKDQKRIKLFHNVIEKYHETIWKYSLTLPFEEWYSMITHFHLPKEFSKVIMYYLAAHEKGEFATHFAYNGDIKDWYYDCRRQARHCLEDQSKAHAEKLFNQMNIASLLRIYARTDLSDFALYCYNMLVNNFILKEEIFIGGDQKSKLQHREIYMKNYDKACLFLNTGHCSKYMFFAVYGNYCLEIKRNEDVSLGEEILNEASNAFTTHKKTTRSTRNVLTIANENGIQEFSIDKTEVQLN